MTTRFSDVCIIVNLRCQQKTIKKNNFLVCYIKETYCLFLKG